MLGARRVVLFAVFATITISLAICAVGPISVPGSVEKLKVFSGTTEDTPDKCSAGTNQLNRLKRRSDQGDDDRKPVKSASTSNTFELPFPTFNDARAFATENQQGSGNDLDLEVVNHFEAKVNEIFSELLLCVGDHGIDGKRFADNRIRLEAEVNDINSRFTYMIALGNIYYTKVKPSARLMRSLFHVLQSRLGLELRSRAPIRDQRVLMSLELVRLQLSLYNLVGPGNVLFTGSPDYQKNLTAAETRLNTFMRENELHLLGDSVYSELLQKDVSRLRNSIRGLAAFVIEKTNEHIYDVIYEDVAGLLESSNQPSSTEDVKDEFVSLMADVNLGDANPPAEATQSFQDYIKQGTGMVARSPEGASTHAPHLTKQRLKLALPPRRISSLSSEAVVIQINEIDRQVESLYQYLMNLKKYTDGIDYSSCKTALGVQKRRLEAVRAKPMVPEKYKDKLEEIFNTIQNMESFIESFVESVSTAPVSEDPRLRKTGPGVYEPSAPSYDEIYEVIPGENPDPFDKQIINIEFELREILGKRKWTPKDVETHAHIKAKYLNLLSRSDKLKLALTEPRKANLRRITNLSDFLTDMLSKLL